MNEKYEKKADNPYQINYDNYLDTDACTECTGLMLRPAQNFNERESYREIFNYDREYQSFPEDYNEDVRSD